MLDGAGVSDAPADPDNDQNDRDATDVMDTNADSKDDRQSSDPNGAGADINATTTEDRRRLEINRRFENITLRDRAAVTGDRDEAGNLLNPEGQVVIPWVVEGLLNIRNTFVSQLQGFAKELVRLRELPRADKVALARRFHTAAGELKNALVNMEVAGIDGTRTIVNGPMPNRTMEDIYNLLMHQAAEREQLGDHQGAQAARQRAGRTGWGLYLQRRADFYNQLAANPILGIANDDGDYLYEVLSKLNLFQQFVEGRSQLEIEQQLVDILNEFLESGRNKALQQARDARGLTDIADLWKFAGPPFKRQQEVFSSLGRQSGATRPQLLMEMVQHAYEEYATAKGERERTTNAIVDFSLGTLAAITMFIPVAGPLVAVGVSSVYITRDGNALYVAYQTEQQARESAPVTGYEYVITAEDRSAAATGQFVFTTVFWAVDVAGVSTIHVLKRGAVLGRSADDVAEASDDVARASDDLPTDAMRPSVMPGLEVGSARSYLTVDQLNDDVLGDALAIAYSEGVPQEVIEDILQRTRANPDFVQNGLLNPDGTGRARNELIIAIANHNDNTIVYHARESGMGIVWDDGEALARIEQFAGGMRIESTQPLDLVWTDYVKAYSRGTRHRGWDPRAVDFAKRRLLPVDDDQLLNMWDFNLDEGGFVRLFTEQEVRNLRAAFANGDPPIAIRSTDSPASPGQPGVELRPPDNPVDPPAGFDGMSTNTDLRNPPRGPASDDPSSDTLRFSDPDLPSEPRPDGWETERLRGGDTEPIVDGNDSEIIPPVTLANDGADVVGVGDRLSLENMSERDFWVHYQRRVDEEQLRQLVKWAGEVGVPHHSIAEAFFAGDPHRQFFELIAVRSNLQIVPLQEAQHLIWLSTRVFAGTATADDQLRLIQMANSLQHQERDLFDELARLVTLPQDELGITSEAFERLFNDESILQLREFVRHGPSSLANMSSSSPLVGSLVLANKTSLIAQMNGTNQKADGDANGNTPPTTNQEVGIEPRVTLTEGEYGGTKRTIEYFDTQGRRTRVILVNEYGLETKRTSFTYDDDGRIKEVIKSVMTEEGVSSTSLTYEYHTHGNIKTIRRTSLDDDNISPNGAVHFDGLGRIIRREGNSEGIVHRRVYQSDRNPNNYIVVTPLLDGTFLTHNLSNSGQNTTAFTRSDPFPEGVPAGYHPAPLPVDKEIPYGEEIPAVQDVLRHDPDPEETNRDDPSNQQESTEQRWVASPDVLRENYIDNPVDPNVRGANSPNPVDEQRSVDHSVAVYTGTAGNLIGNAFVQRHVDQNALNHQSVQPHESTNIGHETDTIFFPHVLVPDGPALSNHQGGLEPMPGWLEPADNGIGSMGDSFQDFAVSTGSNDFLPELSSRDNFTGDPVSLGAQTPISPAADTQGNECEEEDLARFLAEFPRGGCGYADALDLDPDFREQQERDRREQDRLENEGTPSESEFWPEWMRMDFLGGAPPEIESQHTSLPQGTGTNNNPNNDRQSHRYPDNTPAGGSYMPSGNTSDPRPHFTSPLEQGSHPDQTSGMRETEKDVPDGTSSYGTSPEIVVSALVIPDLDAHIAKPQDAEAQDNWRSVFEDTFGSGVPIWNQENINRLNALANHFGLLSGNEDLTNQLQPVVTESSSGDTASIPIADRSDMNDDLRLGHFQSAGPMDVGARDMALGDIDADGDLDAVLAGMVIESSVRNGIWLNDGKGNLTESHRNLGVPGRKVALGDLDGDDDLDVVMTNSRETATIWLNDGNGFFVDSGQTLGISNFSGDIALGDLDADGDLDLFVGGGLNDPNNVWFNDGHGRMEQDQQPSRQPANGMSVHLGDADGDGDLDAFVSDKHLGVQVLINDGKGGFTPSRQHLGFHGADLIVGDVDGDQDLDVIITSFAPLTANLWLNNGQGRFTKSSQYFGEAQTGALADVDNDGDLDALLVNPQPGLQPWLTRIWLNVDGRFTDSGQVTDLGVGSDISRIAVGDVDGDNDIDVLLAGGRFDVWTNLGAPPHRSSAVAEDLIEVADRREEPVTKPSERVLAGDADGNGVFNSSDIVLVFQAGKYEDGISNNTTFQEGDWNGDGTFSTADLVVAFQLGIYV